MGRIAQQQPSRHDVPFNDRKDFWNVLTRREQEYQVLRWNGMTWGQIARTLDIAPRTVRQYAENCHRKWEALYGTAGENGHLSELP